MLDAILQATTFDTDQTAREAVAFIEKANRATAQAQEFYAEAGMRLRRLKENKPAGVPTSRRCVAFPAAGLTN